MQDHLYIQVAEVMIYLHASIPAAAKCFVLTIHQEEYLLSPLHAQVPNPYELGVLLGMDLNVQMPPKVIVMNSVWKISPPPFPSHACC